MNIRKAGIEDLQKIQKLVDWWLTGRGKRVGVAGATHDCFVTPSMHKKYIEKYTTWLMEDDGEIIGWAVVTLTDKLIHFLIVGHRRGQGLGTRFMEHIRPRQVRSKTNQGTGDPTGFYEALGYKVIEETTPKGTLNQKLLVKKTKKTIKVLERSW